MPGMLSGTATARNTARVPRIQSAIIAPSVRLPSNTRQFLSSRSSGDSRKSLAAERQYALIFLSDDCRSILMRACPVLPVAPSTAYVAIARYEKRQDRTTARVTVECNVLQLLDSQFLAGPKSVGTRDKRSMPIPNPSEVELPGCWTLSLPF